MRRVKRNLFTLIKLQNIFNFFMSSLAIQKKNSNTYYQTLNSFKLDEWASGALDEEGKEKYVVTPPPQEASIAETISSHLSFEGKGTLSFFFSPFNGI